MHYLSRWVCRTLAAFACLLVLAWLYEEATQWLLRWRGEQLLAEVKSLHVGNSSSNLEALVGEWSKRGRLEKKCDGAHRETCYYFITISHMLPSALRGNPDQPRRHWIVGLIDRTGLRSSAVGAGVQTENGVIIEKSFSEGVDLPVRDWYIRDGAYVPALTVSSEESTQFRNPNWREHTNSAHPFRYARRYKGPYGLGVAFTSNESTPEKEKLVDFRFSCITRLLPCRNERAILPEGARLLEADVK